MVAGIGIFDLGHAEMTRFVCIASSWSRSWGLERLGAGAAILNDAAYDHSPEPFYAASNAENFVLQSALQRLGFKQVPVWPSQLVPHIGGLDNTPPTLAYRLDRSALSQTARSVMADYASFNNVGVGDHLNRLRLRYRCFGTGL